MMAMQATEISKSIVDIARPDVIDAVVTRPSLIDG
jgi:hypothetical protein